MLSHTPVTSSESFDKLTVMEIHPTVSPHALELHQG